MTRSHANSKRRTTARERARDYVMREIGQGRMSIWRPGDRRGVVQARVKDAIGRLTKVLGAHARATLARDRARRGGAP